MIVRVHTHGYSTSVHIDVESEMMLPVCVSMGQWFFWANTNHFKSKVGQRICKHLILVGSPWFPFGCYDPNVEGEDMRTTWPLCKTTNQCEGFTMFHQLTLVGENFGDASFRLRKELATKNRDKSIESRAEWTGSSPKDSKPHLLESPWLSTFPPRATQVSAHEEPLREYPTIQSTAFLGSQTLLRTAGFGGGSFKKISSAKSRTWTREIGETPSHG